MSNRIVDYPKFNIRYDKLFQILYKGINTWIIYKAFHVPAKKEGPPNAPGSRHRGLMEGSICMQPCSENEKWLFLHLGTMRPKSR